VSKIGVFGGSFDPVHFGHIYLARQAVAEVDLDSLLVVPAEIQPFKPERPLTSGTHRAKMAELAFGGDAKIKVSDLELKKGGISYTIDTLREIKKTLEEGDEIYFVIGADAFLKVEKWKDPEELLREYGFIVGARPGYKKKELEDLTNRLKRVYNINITTINNKLIDISSTEIKSGIESGGSLKDYLPAEVESYIKENGLYRELY